VVKTWISPEARKGAPSEIAGRGLFAVDKISLGEVVAVKGTPKTTKSRRSIALDPTTLVALRLHRDAQDAERAIWAEVYTDLDLVFCREDGTPLRPDSITRRFHDLSLRANLPPIRLHNVRHTYASIGQGAGTHPKVMAERLGHATVGSTLDTYSHVAPALAKQAADDLAALILAPPQTD